MAKAVENIPVKTISQFKSQLLGGGARPNLFEVQIPEFPSAVGNVWGDLEQRHLTYLCKASALPAQNIASIDVPFRGRTFKVAGDRTIDNWSVTIINDQRFNLRTAFEQWTEAIAKLDNNMGTVNPNTYMTDAYIYQLGRGATKEAATNAGDNSAILATYKFIDIWPITVGDIALSYDTGDTIEEFDVEFAVQSIQLDPDNGPVDSPISG